MNETLLIIRQEHRNLRALLASLTLLVGEIDEGGKEPDFRILHGILTYLDEFLDRFHHPKEDSYLFPALRRRQPQAGRLLDELEAQHGEGVIRLNELRRALSAYEFKGRSALPAFRQSVEAYVEFEKAHAIKEERELFPLAEASLEASDWRDVHEAFTAHEDPLFGDQPREAFAALHKSLVNLMPAPYGLGPSWH